MVQPRNVAVRMDRNNEFVRNNIQDLVALGRQQGTLPEPPANVVRQGQDAVNEWYMTRANQFTVRVAREELEANAITRDDDGNILDRPSAKDGPVGVVEPNRGQGGILVGIPSYAREREGTAAPGKARPGGLRKPRSSQAAEKAPRSLGFTTRGQRDRARRLGYENTPEGAQAYQEAVKNRGNKPTPRYVERGN
jgi:hypothetical protein